VTAVRRLPTAARRAVVAAAVALAALPVPGCDRTVRPTEALPPLAAASADADAGSWRMLVLGAPDQVPVPPRPPSGATRTAPSSRP
jgi:hypothetical protein